MPSPNTTAAADPSPAQLVAFERKHPGFGPGKVDVIRAELGITEVRYCVLLDRALDDPDAIKADPVYTRQLREQRDRPYPGRARIFHHTS